MFEKDWERGSGIPDLSLSSCFVAWRTAPSFAWSSRAAGGKATALRVVQGGTDLEDVVHGHCSSISILIFVVEVERLTIRLE